MQENDSEKLQKENSNEDHEEANLGKAHVTKGTEALHRKKSQTTIRRSTS